jgi:ornithine carbamoyltransferase
VGDEVERGTRIRAFQGYEVDAGVLAVASHDAIFLHCLPAHRGLEVSPSVIDGTQSLVFDQAENRLHTAVAVLLALTDRARADEVLVPALAGNG